VIKLKNIWVKYL